MKKVTVIIPCYNEEAGIGDVIAGFPRQQLASHGYKLDILVIDNNSSDRTTQVAQAAGARVIFEPKPGKGNAVRTGFANLAKDTQYVAMLDGDDTYKSRELLRLLEPIDSGFSQVIIGSRMHGRIKPGSMKPLNYLGNRTYSRLVRMGYKVKVSDVLTGYFAWTRKAVLDLRPHLKSQGFAIEMEMITKLARLGYDIFSVPVSYEPRQGDSSLNPLKDGARILWMYSKNLVWRPMDRPLGRIPFSLLQPRLRGVAFYETLRNRRRP